VGENVVNDYLALIVLLILKGCFLPTLKISVKKALATGKIAIDWWESDGPIYFLRPATKDKVGVVYDPSWGGQCIFLTPTGCELSKRERPEFCKRVEPNENGDCDAHTEVSSKLAGALMWKKSKVDLGDTSYFDK